MIAGDGSSTDDTDGTDAIRERQAVALTHRAEALIVGRSCLDADASLRMTGRRPEALSHAALVMVAAFGGAEAPLVLVNHGS
jgi:hypothetical protein